ncbi:MAG: TonB-dependent receptor [Bacteroidia bacterium]|nr:TonB-dependent receptor [Bacteroidia bacterium]
MSLLMLAMLQANGQQATLFGTITDSSGNKISDASIQLSGVGVLGVSDEAGSFSITVPANTKLNIIVSHVGRIIQLDIAPLQPNQTKQINVILPTSLLIKQFVKLEELNREKVSTYNIDIKEIKQMPNVSGSFESILKTLAGVTSNNELSSQYNVRGGNYDENLIYVNDIEIYRPFLPRSGQQEGLSFIHPELVQNITFSAGGFEARYGDKLSSVLDIKYKTPKKFASSASVGLMGATGHVEGLTKNHRFNYLISARYWTNQYILQTLDVSGDYRPNFTDIQSLVTWQILSNLSLSMLASYANNVFLVVPENRETVFGTVNQALQLRMFFEGQDKMQYRTGTGALALTWAPNKRTSLKLTSSIFNSNEGELFTVEGAYRLEEVETDFGNDNFGRARATKGIGYFLNHARNRLDVTVFNIGHRGTHYIKNGTIQWGGQFQSEQVFDKINEWQFRDSLGFSQPSQVNGMPVVSNYLNTSINLNSFRYSGYIQHSHLLNRNYNWNVTYGVRTNWWSFNNENVISPRVQMSIEPNRKHNRGVRNGLINQPLKRDIVIKAAWGFYYQPPFYRELRDFDGVLNKNIRAQRTIHYVLGADMNIKVWKRPFKLFAEVYYKQMSNLIPYEIDNVRIRYYADNIAEGYATGIDMRVNGEFVKGVESWMSMSVMQTQERIPSAVVTDRSGNRVKPGYVPRPTDQRVTFSMFFQDYLPNNDKFKVNLTVVFGTGLPFGPPDRNRYADTLRMPSYRRVDIGFLRMLVNEDDKEKKGWKKHIRSAWIGLDVFNLLGINNTISHLWIQDVEARTWAVPNYLTNRRLNLRLQVYF